ncbi:uncharacterized protein LOC105426879 isoform X1 [Pogonomyrmex barbatus]|uniref:Uncharacterized protein LOC105426879 isoform X1 n=1 Tax=Pogonomyrmex barbatus TaxID=144034 RepID=A0A6I9WXD4_9HYME|nr:uncharacterized protein LOC105426879 isoform X1 [Pogonomyrmex barbatus]
MKSIKHFIIYRQRLILKRRETKEDKTKQEETSNNISLCSNNDLMTQETMHIYLDNKEQPFTSTLNKFMEKELNKFLEQTQPVKRKRVEKDTMDSMEYNVPRKKLQIHEDVKSEACSPILENTTNANRKRFYKASFPCKTCVVTILLSTFILLLSVILYQNRERKHSMEYAKAAIELRNQVFGQENAIEDLTEVLQRDEPFLRLIILCGGSGVGKSYSVDIIRQNFATSFSVRTYYPPLKPVKFYNNSLLHPSLIILDNLKYSDVPSVIEFLKAQNLDKYVHRNSRHLTVLAVFTLDPMTEEQFNNINTRDTLLYQTLNRINLEMHRNDIDSTIIPYDFLSEKHIERCITNAASNSNLYLTDEQIEFIKKYLHLNQSGCKGAYSKVQIIARE